MTTYNGWANRETWLVNVWFGDYFAKLAEEGTEVDAVFIQGFVEEHVDEYIEPSSFLADMLDFSGIDWDSLAERYAPNEEAADDEVEG